MLKPLGGTRGNRFWPLIVVFFIFFLGEGGGGGFWEGAPPNLVGPGDGSIFGPLDFFNVPQKQPYITHQDN